jgi:hypothetical protein
MKKVEIFNVKRERERETILLLQCMYADRSCCAGRQEYNVWSFLDLFESRNWNWNGLKIQSYIYRLRVVEELCVNFS